MNYSVTFFSLFLLVSSIYGKHVPEIHKQVLENGLTVLLVPRINTPDVALQLYYHVGSKDEDTHEKGIAHLLEHMVFKGTKELLSEGDIDAVTHKLSGYSNAFTTYDKTAYIFNFPTRYWQEALPILADCMTNCTFKQDLLNAEFKAVIQELKMRRDNYSGAIYEELLSSAFPDHPYHYPIIGYKHDIWDVHSADLHAFYKKYYQPNNATLVIVGDIDPQQSFELIEDTFGHIPAGPQIERKVCRHTPDLVSKSSVIYRDITQPEAIFAYTVPGLKNKNYFIQGALKHILVGGTSSRLYKKVVEQEQLAYSISGHVLRLEDYSLIIFGITPKSEENLSLIKKHIQHELEDIALNGLTQDELLILKNNIRSYWCDIHENNYQLAHHIAQLYLATQDEHYAVDPEGEGFKTLNEDLKHLITTYCRPNQIHSVCALPLEEQDKLYWQTLQEKALEEDNAILQARIRESEVEEPRYADTVDTIPFKLTKVCIPQEFTLSNGLHIIAYNNPLSQKTICDIRLKTKKYHIEPKQELLYDLLSTMLIRGTQNYSFEEISDLVTKQGATISLAAGKIGASMFNEDIESTLTLVASILKEPFFDEEHLHKVKEQFIRSTHEFYQEPSSIASYLLKNTLYEEEIELDKQKKLDDIHAINKTMLQDFYHTIISPHDAYAVIVGNFEDDQLKDILEKTLGSWQGNRVEVENPAWEFEAVKEQLLEYPMQREQVILALGSRSVPYAHKDFRSLMIASTILSHGMHSRLFQVRQKTGLFYSAHGSFVDGASYKPGLISLTTSVTPDNVEKAEELLFDLLNNFADSITDEEVEQAKEYLLNGYAYAYATNQRIAGTLLTLKKYNERWDAIKDRVEHYTSITPQQVRQAVRDVLKDKKFVRVRVGLQLPSQ